MEELHQSFQLTGLPCWFVNTILKRKISVYKHESDVSFKKITMMIRAYLMYRLKIVGPMMRLYMQK